MFSGNYIFRKPNKRNFDLALEKAQRQPDQVWHVGDQYECDVKGSLQAGLFPVWYTGAVDLPSAMELSSSMKEDKTILTVTGWDELRRYMEKIRKDNDIEA